MPSLPGLGQLMKQVALELFLQIAGIGSASGLVYNEPSLYVISDNSTFLYRYDTGSKRLETIALSETPSNIIAKKDKPDFEAIAQKDGKLYLVGSGSTAKRNEIAVYNPEQKSVTRQNLKPLYDLLSSHANLDKNQLNIEGLMFHEQDVLLFQRGNGESGNNGIFTLVKLDPNATIDYIPVVLPKIGGVPASFTDATRVNGRVFFLASAEDSNSTYLDGEVAGSLIGEIDLQKRAIVSYQIIPGKHKFEGLTFYSIDQNSITFLACEDNDTDLLESAIYKLKVTF